jgi:hypothetical protein
MIGHILFLIFLAVILGCYLYAFLKDPVEFIKDVFCLIGGYIVIVWGMLGLLLIVCPVRPYYSRLADNIASKGIAVAIWTLVTSVGIAIWKIHQRNWDWRTALKFIGGTIMPCNPAFCVKTLSSPPGNSQI